MTKSRTPANKGRKLPPEPLSEDEIRALVNACSHRAPTGIRNRALIAVLYRGGVRLNEALDLKPKDVDIKRCTVRVLHGKGDKARLVGLDDTACALLDRWMAKRKELKLTARHYVFCTITDGNGCKPGTAIKDAYVRGLLPRLARKAGIEKRVHAHGFRHTHAYELATEGVPIHVIQKQLGHSNVSVTNRYLDHLNPTEVAEAMRKRQWKL